MTSIQSELTDGLVLEVDLLLLNLHPHPLLQILVEGESVDIPGGRVADPDSIGSVDPEGKNDTQKYKKNLKVHVLKCWIASFES